MVEISTIMSAGKNIITFDFQWRETVRAPVTKGIPTLL